MRNIKFIILVAGILMFFNHLYAQSSDNIRTADIHATDIQTAFWKKEASLPEELSALQILRTSLAASGIYGKDQQLYLDYYNKIKKGIAFSTPETILSSMHKAFFFGKYSALQTQLDTLLRKGTFNCVSSALLYMILAKEADFSVQGIQTTDHAFCIVQAADSRGKVKNIDVETTNPYGYDPGTKKEFTSSFSNVTGFIYVPPTNYHSRTIISDKQMVCLIFQNRISTLLHDRKFTEGRRLAEYSWTFYPSKSNLKVLNTTMVDIAGELNNKRRFDDALHLLVSFSKEFGVDNRNTINTILVNKANTLAASKDIAGMQNMLIEWKNILSDSQTAFLENSITVVSVQNKIEQILATKDKSESQRFFTAYTYIDTLPSQKRSLFQLSQLRNTFYHNWTAAVHNEFARAANAGEMKKAQSILEAALKLDPGNKSLQQDLKKLRSQM